MPREVSSSTKASPPHSLVASSSPPSKPVPGGTSSTKNSHQSCKTQKVGFFETLGESIKNIKDAISKGLEKVFYCIFPFLKSIFEKKQTISPVEKKYYDFQRKLYRVDSISLFLAKKEVKDLLAEFNAFEKLGKIELEKREAKSIFSSFKKSEEPTAAETIKIGKDAAKKDHLKLIAVLKEYYTEQIPKLEDQLKKEKESN
ncbi:MAG: hypothetical protein K940chlam5_00358 [Candidatus Anoxychlamydiales bacterium]|nr:hypothetical protein [Candidatus Anoxychlamydiales bacterium]